MIGKFKQSKCLPDNLDNVFAPPIESPDDDNFVPPDWLMEGIQEVFESAAPPPDPPPFKFGKQVSDARFNSELLRRVNYNFEYIVDNSQRTSLQYGVEFRPIEQLSKIYREHPLFNFFRGSHQNGMEYFYRRELSKDERMAELEAQMTRGNHQLANSKPKQLLEKVYRDVVYGFAVPVLASIVKKLPGAMVQPCGLAAQFALTRTGERVLKDRLTHNLSHSITQYDASVNMRSNIDAYPEMIFGWCLLRLIHFICALRLQYPGMAILIAKFDFSDAYRRMRHKAKTALETILIVGQIAFVMIRLSFGGSVNPPSWCCFPKMLTDLSNEIPLMKDWDPDLLRSPVQKVIPEPEYLDESIPFSKARPMAVSIPTTGEGRLDCFIDDIIRVFLAVKENLKRQTASVPLASFISMRPHAGEDKPIPQREPLNPEKMEAKGVPREIQIVLGWLINTRLLILCLPDYKYTGYSDDIQRILQAKQVTRKELESILGKLIHASYVIPLARHFLSRLRQKLQAMREADLSRFQHWMLHKEELDNLELWMKFLKNANEGISLNGLTLRNPTRIAFSDSCSKGLGGFTHGERAWRLKVEESSPIYDNDTANNALEFLRMVINLWLSFLECNELGLEDELVLLLGDNTSAIAWLFRSNLPSFSPYYKVVIILARKLAELSMKFKNFIASQHLKECQNVVADFLSFKGEDREIRGEIKSNPLAYDFPPNDVVTSRTHNHFPQLIPAGFAVSHLPTEILSFANHAGRILQSSLIRKPKGGRKAMTECGGDGRPSVGVPWKEPHHVFTEYEQSRPDSSSRHSLTCTVDPSLIPSQEQLLESVKTKWQEKISEKSPALWVRRSGTVSDGVPFTSKGTVPGQ